MRQVSCVVLALVSLPLIAAEVYRSIDANGNVVYSDRPEEGQSPVRIVVATPAVSAPVRPTPPASAEPGPQSEELNAEVLAERSTEEVAAERARNCAVSEERAERYGVSQRLYRNLPNGEREYLSDAELDEARAKAEADVATWCR